MIDPLSFWLNACKCPLQLLRITAVILGFSSVKGTNPQILPPKVSDEQPRLLAFGKRKWGKRVNPCAHDNYLRSIISSTQVLRRPLLFVIPLTVGSTSQDSSHNRFLHWLTPARRTMFPVGGYSCRFFPVEIFWLIDGSDTELPRSFFFLKITWRHSNNQ